MDTASLDHALRQAAADGRLQAAERQALVDWAARNAGDDQARAVARSRAFAVARETLDHPVVDWLEDVLKALVRPKVPVAAPPEKAAAFFSPGTSCIHEVVRQFGIVRKTADVCVFTVTDDRITDAILKAHARGVAVRLVTDDEKAHDLGSDAERLRCAGISCKMDVGQVAHMHHKFALFDGVRLMTGSFNWTRSASEQNEENLIVTADPVLVSAFAERFHQLWARMR